MWASSWVRTRRSQLVVVAELVAAVGGDGANVDERIRERSREAVGVVGDVGEDDLHPADARVVPRLVPGEDLVGQRRRLPRHGLELPGVVDDDVPRLEGAEAKVRRERGSPDGGGHEHGDG